MQVSHAGEDVTVAVIGGGKTKAYGINNSAEFMLTMADGLYQNKLLAAIQEVLCNSWDAHIASKRTHMPIKVTLTRDSIEFQDSGEGIPFDIIEDIYCVYGASTKKLSEEETGGFGLGSKAPYAYVDQLTMTNARDGKSVTYAGIKSDPNEEGRPSFRDLVTIPAVHTGIKVSFAILSENDQLQAAQYIRDLAFFADMNVELNGEKLEISNINNLISEEQRWAFSSRRSSATGNGSDNSPITVRIGAVVYPVPPHERYMTMYKQIEELCNIFNKGRWNGGYHLMLFAKSGSVSMTPSRETLSMNERSVENLHDLMYDFCTKFNDMLANDAYKLTRIQLDKAFATKDPAHFLDYTNDKIPLLDELRPTFSGCFIADTAELVKFSISHNTPTLPGFREWLKREKLRILRNTREFYPNVNVKLWRLAIKKYGSRNRYAYYENEISMATFWKENVFTEVKRKMTKQPNLKLDNLRMFQDVAQHRYYGDKDPTPEALNRIRIPSLEVLSAYLRRVVIITPSLGDLFARSEFIPDELLEGSVGYGEDKRNMVLIYWTRRSKVQQQEAIKAFTALGYRIIDFTTKNSWEPETVKANSQSEEDILAANTPLAPKPVLPGYKPFAMNRRMVGKNHQLTLVPDNVENFNVIRLIEPDAIMFLNQWGNYDDLARFDKPLMKFIRFQYGHRVGVVDNKTRYRNAIKRGVKPILTLLLEDVYKHFQLSKTIRESYYLLTNGDDGLNYSPRVRRSTHIELFKLIAFDPYLSKNLLGRVFHRPKGDDYFWMQIWNNLQNRSTTDLTDEQIVLMDDIRKLIKSFPYREAHLSKIETFSTNPYLMLLDTDCVFRALAKRRAARGYLFGLYTRKLLLKTLKGNL